MLHTTLCPFFKNNAFAELLVSSTAESALGLPSPVVLYVNTQLGDQVKIKDTSKSIKGISIVLQKLLKYFNDTAISTFSFSISLPSNFLAILVL